MTQGYPYLFNLSRVMYGAGRCSMNMSA